MKGTGQAPRRAAIYTRKSTSAGLERDFNSLDAQREACESYAKSQGWKIVGTYDDGGFTGANIDRPAFQRLLADIEAGQIDVVVVYKVDRLSRSLLDFARVMERFSKAGTAFVSVTQHFSTADAMGRLTLNMLMSFAEYEREMIADRTRDKIVAARRKGKWTGGTVPIGYYVIDRKLVKNAPEAIVIKEVFDLYEAHGSVLDVLRELRARDRARRKGQWTKDAVLRVLRNPLYAALIAAGGELCVAEHEPIVERAQFERVQALLAERRGPMLAAPSRNVAYLLRGLLQCGVCGAAMTPGGSRGYRYYRCVSRDKGGAQACTARPLPARAIETFVVERLRELATDRTCTAELASRMRRRFESDTQALSAERAALPPRIAKLASETQTLLATIADLPSRARRLAEKRLEAAALALETAEAQLATVEQKQAALKIADADAAWVAEALGDFGGLWELMTPDNRQRLVSALVENVEVNEPRNEIRVRLARLGEAA
jgi:DNA invertase Pin-like site-specific DNA recombinase